MFARLSLLSVVVTVVAGCPGLTYYSVERTPVEDCIIRPSGEFCDDPETLPPATLQSYAVEITEKHTLIYVGEETWVADGNSGEREVVKAEQTQRNGCTSSKTRTLVFDEDGDAFTGSFEIKTRVTGPESCGQTPFGDRRTFRLAGGRSDSL